MIWRPGRAVLSADPAAARRRREEAQKDARVELWREDAGTAALCGFGLPPDAALAADQRIRDRSIELKAAGVPGTMDQLRLDTGPAPARLPHVDHPRRTHLHQRTHHLPHLNPGPREQACSSPHLDPAPNCHDIRKSPDTLFDEKHDGVESVPEHRPTTPAAPRRTGLMTQDDIIALVASLPGTVTASEAIGAPEVAWGDSFSSLLTDAHARAAKRYRRHRA